MKKQNDYEWLKVGCRANVNEDISDESVAEGVEAVLERHVVGIASSTAALEYLSSSPVPLHETTMISDEIGMAYGYPPEVDYDSFKRTPHVRVWSPQTVEECDEIMQSLSGIDPNIYSREYFEGALKGGLGRPGQTVYAAGDKHRMDARAILVMLREMEFYGDQATIYYHVRACHSEGTVHQTAAIQAALYYQARADIECAILSMHAAGLTPKFDMQVFVDDDDDGMYSQYVEQVELARGDAFTFGKIPEGIDFDAYGPWILGQDRRKSEVPHVVVRSMSDPLP
jgi:hypothetical protein